MSKIKPGTIEKNLSINSVGHPAGIEHMPCLFDCSNACTLSQMHSANSLCHALSYLVFSGLFMAYIMP